MSEFIRDDYIADRVLFAADEIKRLRAELEQTRQTLIDVQSYAVKREDKLRTALEQLMTDYAAHTVKLRAALNWYADASNYEPGQDIEDILIDGGQCARSALEETK